jgi:hypothetical protein
MDNKEQDTVTNKKVSLEDVLNASNFEVYQLAAAAIDKYSRMKDHPGFSVKSTGELFYNALVKMSQEASDENIKKALELKADAMVRNVKDGTLTKDSLNSTSEYMKSFLPSYINRIKDNVQPEHHNMMALGIIMNKDRFPDEFNKLSAIPGGARPVQLGIILNTLKEDMANNNTSNLPSYYEKLTPLDIVKSYMNIGMTQDQAKATVAAGKKCYTDLVNSLGDSSKAEHMMYVQKVVERDLAVQSKKIDGGELKKLVEGSDPVNYLNMLSAPLGINRALRQQQESPYTE